MVVVSVASLPLGHDHYNHPRALSAGSLGSWVPVVHVQALLHVAQDERCVPEAWPSPVRVT